MAGPAAPQVPGYRDLTLLGRGGYSEVYRAYQEQFDRWVAVKLLTFMVSDESSRQRFLSECRMAGRVSAHPNIVTVYDAGIVPDGRPYIAMELCEQGSVSDRMAREGPFEMAEALRIAVAIAGALESAHRAGVVHRDVKPGNVMLTSYGQPALTDFGLSIVVERQEVSTGVDALSPHYAPPEALESSVATTSADVYSLTATTYAMLAGRPPYQTGSDDPLDVLVERILHTDVPPVPRPEVPASLQTVLHFGMARDPAMRAPSAFAFAQALQQVEEELGLSVTQPVVLDPPAGADTPPPATEATASATDEITVERELYAAQATAVDVAAVPAPEAPPGVIGGWADPSAMPVDWSDPGTGETTVGRQARWHQPPQPTGQQEGDGSGSRTGLLVALLVVLIAGALGVLVYLLTTGDDDETASSGTTTTVGGRDSERSSTTGGDDESTTTSGGDDATTSSRPSTTATTQPPPAGPLGIGEVTASGTAPDAFDACNTATTFAAGNVADGEATTAWRVAGDGVGQTLTITLEGEHHVSEVGLLPGYAKTDPCDGTDRWHQNRRPTQVTWTFDDGTTVDQPLDDVASSQTVAVDATTTTIQVRIDGTTSDPGRDFTAISEVSVQGS
jgi:tRNA A-37 threonylcarbamoyl transferase component Bud32